MEAKVEEKLIKLFSQFVGQKLIHAELKERKIGEKDILLLEMTFSDEGAYRAMTLALDKELTESDDEEIAEKILK